MTRLLLCVALLCGLAGCQDQLGRTVNHSGEIEVHFSPRGGYVALAKRYRAYAAEHGLIVTLAEKLKKNPNLQRLFGAPDVWGDAGLRFAQEAGIPAVVFDPKEFGSRDGFSEAIFHRCRQAGVQLGELGEAEDRRVRKPRRHARRAESGCRRGRCRCPRRCAFAVCLSRRDDPLDR